MLAILVADNSAGLAVWFAGGGTCTASSTDEDLTTVQTQ
jgi:hypothetical protein